VETEPLLKWHKVTLAIQLKNIVFYNQKSNILLK